MSFTPIYIAEMSERPVLVQSSNRFYIPAKERGQLLTAKANHRKLLQKHYGPSWKRHLNVPEKELPQSIHVQY